MVNLKIGLIGMLMAAAFNVDEYRWRKNLPDANNHGCYGGKFSGVAKAKRLAKKIKNQKKAKSYGKR